MALLRTEIIGPSGGPMGRRGRTYIKQGRAHYLSLARPLTDLLQFHADVYPKGSNRRRCP